MTGRLTLSVTIVPTARWWRIHYQAQVRDVSPEHLHCLSLAKHVPLCITARPVSVTLSLVLYTLESTAVQVCGIVQPTVAVTI